MKAQFSDSWNSSKKPNKQRKFRFNAPLHIKGNFLNAHLSKELRKKYNMRSLRVRVGDKVRILRGQFKKQEGKVEEVDVRTSKIFVSKVEHVKRDGTKARHPLEPSNVLIVEVNTDDKRRFKERSVVTKKASKASKSESSGQTGSNVKVQAKKEKKSVEKKNAEKPKSESSKSESKPTIKKHVKSE
ncbi:MAG: 50S ribosomal protein L24 [Candidatus Woesearchaeota archaeon]